MSPRTEQLIRDYLNQLSVAAQGCLTSQDRRALIAGVRERIDGHLLSAADTSPRAVRQFLEGLGDPAAIVDSEAERLAQQIVTAGRLRVPDWQKGLRSTVQLRPRRAAKAMEQAAAEPVDGQVLSGPAVSGPALNELAVNELAVNEPAVNGAGPDHRNAADADERTETAAPHAAHDAPAAAQPKPAAEAVSASHIRGDVGISLVTSRAIAEPAASGPSPGSEAEVPGQAQHDTAATSDPATAATSDPAAAATSDPAAAATSDPATEAAAAAHVSAQPANHDGGVGLVIGRTTASAAANPLVVERPFGAPRRPPGQTRGIVRKAPPTGAAKAAETAASAAAVEPPRAPSPPVAAWRVTARTTKDHPLETAAITVLAIGTLIYPPIWLLGVVLSLPARAWDYRDKWTGLAGPVFLLAIAVGLYTALGRGSASVSMFFHHAWLFASYFSRVVALLGAGFLGWRLVHGHPPWTVPPWNRRTDPG